MQRLPPFGSRTFRHSLGKPRPCPLRLAPVLGTCLRGLRVCLRERPARTLTPGPLGQQRVLKAHASRHEGPCFVPSHGQGTPRCTDGPHLSVRAGLVWAVGVFRPPGLDRRGLADRLLCDVSQVFFVSGLGWSISKLRKGGPKRPPVGVHSPPPEATPRTIPARPGRAPHSSGRGRFLPRQLALRRLRRPPPGLPGDQRHTQHWAPLCCGQRGPGWE